MAMIRKAVEYYQEWNLKGRSSKCSEVLQEWNRRRGFQPGDFYYTENLDDAVFVNPTNGMASEEMRLIGLFETGASVVDRFVMIIYDLNEPSRFLQNDVVLGYEDADGNFLDGYPIVNLLGSGGISIPAVPEVKRQVTLYLPNFHRNNLSEMPGILTI